MGMAKVKIDDKVEATFENGAWSCDNPQWLQDLTQWESIRHKSPSIPQDALDAVRHLEAMPIVSKVEILESELGEYVEGRVY